MTDQTPAPAADGRIHHIPLDAIDADAIPRDRTATDQAAFDELASSISRNGLRMPVELFGLFTDTPDAPAYGLISGHRRLAACRYLRDLSDGKRFTTIAALLRNPDDIAGALAAMVEENEIRASLSPWERAAIAVTARNREFLPTIEQAIDTLYPSATRQKRAILRNIAFLVDETDGLLNQPENLSQRQLLRLHAAWTNGFGEIIVTALDGTSRHDSASQWAIILPVIAESEAPAVEYTARETRQGRPRRLSRPRSNLTLRRERTPDGYSIHFTGCDARSVLMDHIIEEIERLVGER